jgi:hypothetical protein
VCAGFARGVPPSVHPRTDRAVDLSSRAIRTIRVSRRTHVLSVGSVLTVAFVGSIAALTHEALGSGSRIETRSLPPLSASVPRFVTGLCSRTRSRSPIPLVCPPLVPVTKYRSYPGLSGVLLGNTIIPPVKPPADAIYLLSFNNGDNGPAYWHWIAGMGTPQAIRYWVISDIRNAVKGKATRVRVLRLKGHRVEIWRFPEYPAGGEFGGHVAAITRSGPYLAIASIHGYDSAAADARMAVALARKADASR